MKYMSFKLFLTAVLCLALAGCAPAGPQGSQLPSPSAAPTQTAEPSPSAESSPAGLEESPSEPVQGEAATLYIGTRAGGFAEYPMAYEEELTPELLVTGISNLTGWDLTLAEPITTGKGGMSVCFADGSALYAGPPEPQKDEFHMFSAEQLAETLLDSVQKTLQEGFTLAGGDPDLLDIYYYREGELPLELPDLGLSWPLDQPYRWPER